MRAGLRSEIHASAGPVLRVDLVVDDGPAPDETGFTPWDRATFTSGFSTFTEVEMDGPPEIEYGGGSSDADAGDLVVPSFTTLNYAAAEPPQGSTNSPARQWFLDNTADLYRGKVYARIYTVETDGKRDLDWFGRVDAWGMQTPINPATRSAGFSVEVSCGLGPALEGVPAEATTDVPVGSILARALCRANPHNTLRLLLDPYASNQYQDGSSRYSALHLRASTEWAGPAYVSEGLTDTPADADGDYGNIDEILDDIAQKGGLRIYLSASTGDWHAVPATALGEAMTKAEKVVCRSAADGGAVWTFEGIAADEWTPGGPEDINDEPGHAFNKANRLAAVTLDTGGASLVRQPFPTAPVPSLENADTPLDAFETQQLVYVAAEADRRLRVSFAKQGYSGGALAGTEYPGYIEIAGTGASGTIYYFAEAGTWETTYQSLSDDINEGSFSVTATEDFPEPMRLSITLRGGSTSDITISGNIEHADLTACEVRIYDDAGNPVTSWRAIIGQSDLPGDVESYTGAPTMEADEDGAGDWQPVTGWASQRWGTGQTVWAEYAAEAELRRRATPLDAFDGVMNDLLGPEVRPLLPAVTDMEDAGPPETGGDASTAYVMGAGLVIRTDTMDTRGLWFRLPTEAL